MFWSWTSLTPNSPLHSHNNPTSTPQNVLLCAPCATIPICLSSTIILNRSEFLSEADHQLADFSIHQPLVYDPTPRFNSELSSLINNAGPPPQANARMTLSLLHNPQPRNPSLYFLPKIHKRGNPGHPIVASFFSSVTAYIHTHLQPFVKSLRSLY